MEIEINELIKRLESEINNTPTGELRNLLCDCNIVINQLIITGIIDYMDVSPAFIKAIKQLIYAYKEKP